MPASATLTCTTCPHACRLTEGQTGRCRARGVRGGIVVPLSYGRLTSLALDPVEKKPLARWRPGTYVLSIGSFGCNLRCPFCQNHAIAQVGTSEVRWEQVGPDELVSLTAEAQARDPRVVGIAYTYNEPHVATEYVRDAGTLAHEAGLANVLVSNGCASPQVIEALAPLIDAANIDLKGFTAEYYRWCEGKLETVQACIERLAAEPSCHLEVTCLVVPGRNDDPAQMRALAAWLAQVDPTIVLHVTRYFPRWKMTAAATPVATVHRLANVAREALPDVVVGNC